MAETIEETKVYYQEEIPDIDLPETVSYANVIDAPQSVSDLNTVDGQKLEGIEYNAGDPYWINDVINARIDTASKKFLKDFNFGDTDYAGGVYAGDISWNTSTGAITGGSGVVINRAGILGASAGSPTFTLDAVTGDATFTGDVTASTITGGTITGTTITGGTIQTATTGKRLVMAGSPSNQYQFKDGASSVGYLEIDDDGAGGYFAQIYIDHLGAALQVGSTVGASEITYFSAPFFSGSGRSAVGQASIDSNGPSAGLTWSGGSNATWSFNLGTAMARISSDVEPATDGTYDLGTTTRRWAELHTDSIDLNGVTRTTWPTAGADTDLNNLITTSINQSLIPAGATQDLGTSSLPWDRGYIDDIYLTNGDGGIYYNANLALDFYATRIELGSTYSDLSPATSLSSNFGSTNRWSAGYFDTLDLTGAMDMNNNRIDDVDELRLHTGTANSAGAEGAIAFYDSGTIQYRGQIISTEYSFDLTAA